MKTIATGVIAFLALILIWAVPVMGQQTDEGQLESYYAAYIDTLILKSDSRAEWMDSKLHNVRNMAEMARLKAAFLRKNKASIVRDLIAGDVGLKSYKIDRLVNREFYAQVRREEIMMAEAYGKPDISVPREIEIRMARENYATYIEQCIQKCDKKASLISSRSRNLRRRAETARMKASFLRDFRDQLIEDLLIVRAILL
ncbi:MAG: hypothetical protein JJV98_17090 [Desulfosarcina sp.]|nr:hypothetical protein [Desulfobacterales bacterium]